MVDHLNNGETYRRLSEQAKRLPNRPHATTLWRWAVKGVRGIRLDTVLIGGVTYASDEAIDRFLASINEPVEAKSPPVKQRRSKKQRRESAERADAILAAAGL